MSDELNLDGLVEPLNMAGLVELPKPTTSHLPDLLGFLWARNLTPGSTTGGHHNVGSLHYTGNAVDIKGSGTFSDAQVASLKQDAASHGFLIRDERTRPPNQKVWGGPHVHIEFVGNFQTPQVQSDGLNLDGLVEPLNLGGLVEPQKPMKPSSVFGLPATPEKQAIIRKAIDASNPVPPVPMGQVSSMHDIISEAKSTPEAVIRAQIRQQVIKERQETLGGGMNYVFSTLNPFNLTQSDQDWINEQVNERYNQYQLKQSSEVERQRKEFGRQPAPLRVLTQSGGRAGSGILKGLAGLSTIVTGLTQNDLSRYLNERGNALEVAASSEPLSPLGAEIQRGLTEKIAGGGMDVVFNVAELMALKRATGMPLGRIMAIETALKTSDQPFRSRAPEIAKAYAMGRVLDRHFSRKASALLFGAPAAVQTGLAYSQGTMSGEDALLQTAIQTGSGFLLGGQPKVVPDVPGARIDMMPEIPDVPVGTISKPRVIKGGGKDAASQRIVAESGQSEYQGASQGAAIPEDSSQVREVGREQAGDSNRAIEGRQVQQEALNVQGLVESQPASEPNNLALPATPDTANQPPSVSAQGAEQPEKVSTASTSEGVSLPEAPQARPSIVPEVPQVGTMLKASAFGAGEFLKQDVAPLISWIPKAIDAFKRVAAPATRGSIAKQSAETVRDYAGQAARENDIAHAVLKVARNEFSKQPDATNLDFIDRMENGRAQATPELSQVASSMRLLLNKSRDEVKSLKPELLQNFYENYFPHIWKDPQKAQGVFGAFFGKRPFEGSKSFLKQRSLPTIADGIKAGLEPISTNPVDLVLLKNAEIQRFLTAHKTLAEFKANGLAQFVKLGGKPPDGWSKVNDKISDVYFPGKQGLVKSGSYYMPDEASQVLNNYLSPGLAGNAIFDGWRQSNMLMTQAMLGLSAFHGTVTSLNSVMSKISLASQYIAEGKGAEAAKALAKAPMAPITDFFYGKKLQQEWSNPGSHPELAPLVDMMQKGGIRSKMEQVYMTNISRSMRDAFNQGNLPGAAIRAPFALFEQTAKPIMQYLVPRLKMAAAADMMKFEIERLGPAATIGQQRAAAARAVDSVDNRFGMLTYDNLFMNKMVKDGMLSSFLSFGWNLGTFRELGGGAVDIAKAPFRVAKGQQAMTPRIGYTAIALPMVTAIMGSTLNYLMTGKPPREVKDAFFPRTGKIDAHSNPVRLTLPTYAKDAYAFYKRPVTTVQHKLSPGLSTTVELLQNRDYYGNPIWLSDKPIDTKLREVGSYLFDKMTPISLRIQTKAKIPYGRELQFLGVSPAASYINQRREPKPTRTMEVPLSKKQQRNF